MQRKAAGFPSDKEQNVFSKRSLLILIFVFSGSSLLFSQYDPHPEAMNFDEPYRPQFHYCRKKGGMGDINGLWYHNQKYHMMHMGGSAAYATSPDLLHWTHKGVALMGEDSNAPEQYKNMSGSKVWSGSGIITSGEMAERITGSKKEAMIAFYTGTELGTCIAWSTDDGKIWNNFPGNPVGNYTTNLQPRDPCVIWYEPDSKWVLAIHNKHTIPLFSSPDLINWTYLSTVPFGMECPNIYELPLDGDESNKKWVINEASSRYLVGSFDGTTFTTEEGPYSMDLCPNFYASQTFHRDNFPSDKLIQIGWLGRRGPNVESVWKSAASFPVELNLVTYNGKMRVTRWPIAQISNLYERKVEFGPQAITPGQNILADIQSKKMDIHAVFDISGTTASEFGFKIANKKIAYNVKEQTLLGHEFKPQSTDSNIEIRILADWSQLEVFGNGGVYSYSEEVMFTPSDNNVELYAKDGNVKLVSLVFHEIARIWPGAL
jgi:fructan beta-fructosidase